MFTKILLIGSLGLLPLSFLSAQHDLSISQSVDTVRANEGDNVTVRIVLYNQNNTNVTSVQVSSPIPAQLNYLNHSPSSFNYDPGTGIWNVGTLAAATDSLVLSITAEVVSEGVAYHLTEVSSMNGTDDDSTPGNGNYVEDDIANSCVSVAVGICPIVRDTFTLRAPAGLTNYQWYVDSTGTREAIAGANADTLDVSRPGAYSFEADQNTCPAGNCCPVILEEECNLEYDLALIKTASPQSVFPDDTITYTITIANQGNVPSNDFSVMDTIPAGLAFVDADNGGTLSGNIVNWTVANLQPDSLFNLTVRLRVADMSLAPFRNWAEITDDSSEDYGLTDEDSTPDSDPTNDLADDHDDITLDVPPGDADDSDYEDVFEDLTEYDLALIKTANDIDFWVWDTVTYTITVANQGNVNSNTFTVMDSIPTGMAFVDADNGGAENSGAVIWNLANLLPGETVDLTVRMRFTDGSLTPFVNWAEITDDSADDYRTTDEDSTPDSDSTNDQLNDHDDITLDEPPLDEDDSDVETVRVNVAEYDLALIKTADLSQAGMGDQVPYTITVANQGNIPSKDFLVIDVIPAGMSYVSSDNGGWLDGDTVKWVVADLLPGDMIDLRVTLQVDDVSLGTFSNWAEIRDDSSEDYGMTDIDSRPNGSPDDDVIDHDDITQDQVPNDEDDSDFEDVEPIPLEYDLALIKTANPLSAGFGDAVTYVITVANQGNLNSNDFTVIDILPQGMSFLTADNGGVLNGDTVVWTIANLEPDSLIELRVRLQVDDVSNGTFRNWAEISDDSSEDYGLTDDDSTPDSDPTNDWANDHDIITIDGAAGDEDDSDYEDVFPIPMEYDLALIKTANVSEVGSGDEVRFTITVANQGSLDAHDFTVVDLIPNGMSFVSADNGAVEFGGVVTWIIPDLEPGETIDLTVTLRADNTLLGSFRNWAEISDDSSEDYGLTDDDSTPDADPNDDANDHDDITLDDAAGDEDDSDFETIIAIDPGLEPDTIYVTTEYNTPITDICADVSDLPGNYGYTLRCGDPANGFLQVNSLSNCVNYTPDVGFVGVDEACIQVCDDSSPSVCDTVYIIITVEATGCTDFITDATMEGYADACDELLAVCVEIPFAEVSDYRITDNGVAYTNTFEACADDPNNLQLSLESGYHLLNFFDLRTGCQDSLAVTISCPLDSTIRNTVRLDEDNEICFDGFMEGEIISIENTCPESAGNATIVVDTNTNCVIYTGVEVGLDTSCIKICVAPDSCTLYTVVTTVVPACETIFNNDSLVTFTEECDSLARVCLDVPIAEFLLEYGLVHNDGTYDGRFEGCDFDSVVTYTYFTIPDRGASGPYNVDSWMVNGNFYSGQFEDLQSLVDSMNRWDSSSEWFINDNTFLLAGGDPGNIYGDLRISQIGTGRSTRLNENRLFLPNGSAIFLPVGQHEIVLRNVDTGCRDTLAIDVLCVGIDVVYDTITVYNIDTLCLDTLELPGTVVSIDNYCDDSSGEYVSYDIIDDGPCLEIEGIDIGQDSACVVICDDLGNCDTTFIFVMVLPQMIDAVNDADTLIENATEFTKDILRNDTISGQLDTIYLVDNPDHGAVTLNEDGTITYIPNEGYCDSQIPDSVSYAICNMVGCDTATVYFYVFCDDLEIYTGFSPNEDGNNDVFLIDGIEGYPNNTLTIFNRWGNQVYFTRGYLNTWNGKWNGKDLPDGTYFYILDDGQGRTFTGYVQIHR